MPANPWELRADVRPLELAALRWRELGDLMARRGDEIVDAARRATEGWDAAAAESYERHRRQVLANLDRFTQLTSEVAGALRAISSILTSSQQELDLAWTRVAMVPHEVVGESRHLVFRPGGDDDRGTVTRGQAEAEEIRRRLALSLDQESTRLRSARTELVTVRTELTTLAGVAFPPGMGPGEEASGVGTALPGSTSVLGSAQAGGVGLPPIAPASVSMPDLGGPPPAGLTPFVATVATGTARRRGAEPATSVPPPIGGMGAAAMGVRTGTTSRGLAGGHAGPQRLATPTLEGASDEETDRRSRERAAARQAEREAKQAALAAKRADRAARRAERESGPDGRDRSEEPVAAGLDDGLDDGLEVDPGSAAETDAGHGAPRR